MTVQLDVECTECGRVYSEWSTCTRRGESFVPYTFNRTRWSLQYTHIHLAVLVCSTDGVVVVGYACFNLSVDMIVAVTDP